MLFQMYSQARPLKNRKAKTDRSGSPQMVDEMRRFKRLIGKNKATLLDYGFGFGKWARAATEAGFEVTAFEPSAKKGYRK